MKFTHKLALGSLLAGSILLTHTTKALANEGRFILQNTVGGTSRCEVTSGLFPDGQYNLLFLCRDLVYPISSELFIYVVWTQPADGSAPVKLGGLGAGKAYFKTTKAFNTVFVTQERNNDGNLKTPTGPIAMRGNLQTITFLDSSSGAQAPTETMLPGQTVSPSSSPRPRSNVLSNVLKGGGIITAISVFVIILMLILVKPFK